MRTTGKEIVEFCDEILKSRNERIADMCKATGITKALFSMWKSRPDSVPRLDTMISISNYLGLTVSQVIGETEMTYSKELTGIIDMLSELSPISIKAISAVVKTYYDEEVREKSGTNVG